MQSLTERQIWSAANHSLFGSFQQYSLSSTACFTYIRPGVVMGVRISGIEPPGKPQAKGIELCAYLRQASWSLRRDTSKNGTLPILMDTITII